MNKEIIEKLQGFSLSSEEKFEISIDETDIAKSKEECGRSLLGKCFGTKKINFTGLKNTLLKIWQTKDIFVVREIGPNLFQFVFCTQEDKLRVLQGKTWSFDSQYILLREWNDDILAKVDSIHTVELWIQIWNLPYHWMSIETGKKIGSKFGKISDIIIPETGSAKGRHLKLLVEVNLDKPLLRGSKIKLGEEVCWIDFRYENLMSFCFYCGHVGHLERGCQVRKDELKENNFSEGQFGEWLRAVEVFPSRPMNRNIRQHPSQQAVSNRAKEVGKEDTIQETSVNEKGPTKSEKMEANNVVKGIDSYPEGVQAKDFTMKILPCDKENMMGIENSEMVDVAVKAKGRRAPLEEISQNGSCIGIAKSKTHRMVKKITRKGGIGDMDCIPMEVLINIVTGSNSSLLETGSPVVFYLVVCSSGQVSCYGGPSVTTIVPNKSYIRMKKLRDNLKDQSCLMPTKICEGLKSCKCM
ncbi:hypothetical protein DH2020_009240 [Rehmannia glutinosa]|uniref:CCHC-type domain-containing protein n=1 Tax=Rehmannia glutinosa TaxID=99300 RepID=A0ABR0X8Q4_REHGL